MQAVGFHSMPRTLVHFSYREVRKMKSATHYLTFKTPKRRQLVRITDEVTAFVAKSGLREGMVLVSAMHITAGVFVNDDEPGLHRDLERWVQELAPGPAADDSAPG